MKSSAAQSARSPRFQRKAGGQKFKEQAIFLSEQATDLSTSKCTGVLRGDVVMVTARSDIAALVRLGSYGKGLFSRSVPCHNVVPSFSLPPRKRENSKVSYETPLLGGITKSEQELVRKMSNFVQCREKRVALHAQWKMEEDYGSTSQAKEEPHSHAPDFIDEDRSTLPATLSPSEAQSGQSQSSSTAATVSSDHGKHTSDEDGTKLNSLSFEEHQKRFSQRIDQLEQSDQFKMDEYLQLCSEEALYLSHELNVLTITNESKEVMSTQELCLQFCKNKRFLQKYAAYCYYRKKGWVPKSGLKFGVDFVLYKQGPVEYHSNYAVVVRLVCKSTSQSQGASPERSTEVLTWRDVVAFDRVSKSVVKDLIICNVIMKESIQSLEFPDCVEKLKIVEALVKRWDPDKNR